MAITFVVEDTSLEVEATQELLNMVLFSIIEGEMPEEQKLNMITHICGSSERAAEYFEFLAADAKQSLQILATQPFAILFFPREIQALKELIVRLESYSLKLACTV